MTSRGNEVDEDQRNMVVTRSRGQDSGAERSGSGNPNRARRETSDPTRLDRGTFDPTRIDDIEEVHSPHPNRSGQAGMLRSDPDHHGAGTSARTPTNALNPATRTNDQVNPSAPVTQGDFSRFLDMLESTRETMRIQERTNLMMQENMRIMSREIGEIRR